MHGEFAEKLFLGKQPGYKRLNCAQAIAEAFKNQYDFLTDKTVSDFKNMGHGKAPDGQCGMLYAAKYIFEQNHQPEKVREFERYFKQFAGSTQCSDIIHKKIAFCADCVNKTAEFMEQQNKE